jgi:hypothetical protein
MEQYYGIIITTGIVVSVLLLLVAIYSILRILSRQESRGGEESARLREMLLDVLSEQEAVTLRQSQIGSSLNFMNDQLNELQHASRSTTLALSAEDIAAASGVPRLEQRIEALQGQLGEWFQAGTQSRQEQVANAESWANLLGLLATMQDRIGELNQAVIAQHAQPSMVADRMLEALEGEMQGLRAIADDIATLQWKLRRSVIERETSLASLRAEMSEAPKVGERAA